MFAESGEKMATEIYLPVSAQLGYGCDPEVGETRGFALSKAPNSTIGSSSGTNEAYFKYAESYSELSELMHFDVSASYKWIGGRVSGALNLLKEAKISSHTISIIGYVKICTPSLLVHPEPQLSDAAKNLFKRDKKAFFTTYGSHFISGFTRGGELRALMTLTVNNSTEREKIKTSLHVSGWGANLDAAMRTEKQQILSKHNAELHLSWKGGPPEAIPCSMDTLIQRFTSFQTAVHAEPSDYNAILRPYTDISPQTALDSALLQIRQEEIERLIRFYNLYREYRNNLEGALNEPASFDPTLSRNELNARLAACNDEIDKVKQALLRMDSYENHQGTSNKLPHPSIFGAQVPRLRPESLEGKWVGKTHRTNGEVRKLELDFKREDGQFKVMIFWDESNPAFRFGEWKPVKVQNGEPVNYTITPDTSEIWLRDDVYRKYYLHLYRQGNTLSGHMREQLDQLVQWGTVEVIRQ